MLKHRLLPILVGLSLVLGLAQLRLGDPTPVAAIRDMWFDFYQHLKPRAGDDSPVRIIDIDEASLAEEGQWPWPRTTLATLTTRLNELGAAAIGFDVLFPEPDRLGAAHDTAFANALRGTPSALGFSVSAKAPPLTLAPRSGMAISGSNPSASLPPLPGAVAPLAILAEAAEGLGGLSLGADDSTGIVRRVPMLWSNGETLYPGLSLEMLRLATGQSTIVAMGDTAGGNTLEAVRVGPFTVPTTAAGEVLLYDKPVRPDHLITAHRVLGDDYLSLKAEIEGRIILIGTSASGLLDLHATPLSASTPGVTVHAAMIDQIVSGQFLSRADWVQAVELIAFVITGVLLVLVVLQLGPLAGLAVALVATGGFVAGSWAAFAINGWLIDATFPVTAALIIYAVMVYFQYARAERNRRDVRRAFGYYVAPELLQIIENNAGRLQLGGELRELTVMFADMRGFTSFTEKHTPQDTLATLNTLFGALGHEIVARFGTIDKFIGDSIMAFWNAPVDVPHHARKGALAALAMRETLDDLNARKVFGETGIAIGIGLDTGVALVGNMGLETRFDYSTIGDPVNIASRVEGESKLVGFDIVAAEPTAIAAPELAWLEAGTVQLKGKSARLPIFILVGDDALATTPAFTELRAAHRVLLDALSSGDASAALARCRELAAPIEPRLARFYELIPGRIADFTSRA